MPGNRHTNKWSSDINSKAGRRRKRKGGANKYGAAPVTLRMSVVARPSTISHVPRRIESGESIGKSEVVDGALKETERAFAFRARFFHCGVFAPGIMRGDRIELVELVRAAPHFVCFNLEDLPEKPQGGADGHAAAPSAEQGKPKNLMHRHIPFQNND
jgi:hypothetical protein